MPSSSHPRRPCPLPCLALLAACASSPASPPAADRAIAPIPAAAAPPRALPTARSADPIGALFGADPAPAPASSSPDDYRRWVRAQLDRPGFYTVLRQVIAESTFLTANPLKVVNFIELRVGRSPRRGAFFYRVSPCPERELERVRPWWDPGTEAWICRDDHRPGVLTATTGQSCDTGLVAPDVGCGCGPNLVFCGTGEMQRRLRDAANQELELTMQHLVVSGRPFGDLLTANETVRSGLADLFYARLTYFLGGALAPIDVDAPPSLRRRPDVARGGALSMPAYVILSPLRTLVVSIWNDFLCAPLGGQGVETHVLLAQLAQEGSLTSRSHMNLTRTVGCQSCHARLEYGVLAFAGWLNNTVGGHYDPRLAARIPATTRFFVRDHDDSRGEGPSDLDWLGATIAGQPEFGQCMVSKITRYVYEGADVPFEVERTLVERFADGQRMSALIEDAVVARVFGPAGLGPPARRAAVRR